MRLERDERVFAYVRTLGGVKAWVVLNFTAEVVEVPLGSGSGLGLESLDSGCALILCNYADAGVGSESGLGGMETGTLSLRGYEARVYIQTTQ